MRNLRIGLNLTHMITVEKRSSKRSAATGEANKSTATTINLITGRLVFKSNTILNNCGRKDVRANKTYNVRGSFRATTESKQQRIDTSFLLIRFCILSSHVHLTCCVFYRYVSQPFLVDQFMCICMYVTTAGMNLQEIRYRSVWTDYLLYLQIKRVACDVLQREVILSVC